MTYDPKIVIEKNIPLTPVASEGIFLKTLRIMEVGDSVLFPFADDFNEKRLAYRISSAIKFNTNKKFATRTIKDTGIRVWRKA